MAKPRYYRLKVSGIVKYDDRDEPLELLMLGYGQGEQVERAIQELEEEAAEMKVEMERVYPDGA